MIIDPDAHLISKVKYALQHKDQYTFGQRVLLKFWLSWHITAGYDFNANAAEEKWIIAQEPEIDWEKVDDAWVKNALAFHPKAEYPRVAA
jgi:hypothetical protein